VAAVDNLPSIKQMLDDWDAQQAAEAAGIKYVRKPFVIEAPPPIDAAAATRIAKANRMESERGTAAAQSMDRERRQTRLGQLEGTWVADCSVSRSWFGGGSPTEVAQAKTTEYRVGPNPRSIQDSNGTYEVDYTEYTGGSCDPAGGGYNAKAFAKYNMQGTIMYQGMGVAPDFSNCYQAEWTTTQSTWTFPSDATTEPQVTRLLSILNTHCPCAHSHSGPTEWKAGLAGTRTVHNSDCRRDDITDQSFILCGIIGGLPTYALYQYLPNSEAQQYQSSPLSFARQDGWYNPPSSRPRSRLPHSDAHDSNDCVLAMPIQCGTKSGTLSDAANYCDGCTQLECTGCIYRYIENDKDAPGSPQATWSYCCPCVYYMAREFPWMAVEC
jgi:hypothetical protein